jgi:hypothetical protein
MHQTYVESELHHGIRYKIVRDFTLFGVHAKWNKVQGHAVDCEHPLVALLYALAG